MKKEERERQIARRELQRDKLIGKLKADAFSAVEDSYWLGYRHGKVDAKKAKEKK